MKPLFFENSKVPVILSKLAPININAITLGPFVFSRGTLSERVKRHETIHFEQYLETLFIGFLLIYLYDYIRSGFKLGFNREAYLNIRFEQEAYANDSDVDYLENRKRFAWLKYKL